MPVCETNPNCMIYQTVFIVLRYKGLWMNTENGNSGSFSRKRNISRFERGSDRREVFPRFVILSEAKNLAHVRARPFISFRVTDRCLVVQTVALPQQVAGLTFAPAGS
jgi:hypothetical protein